MKSGYIAYGRYSGVAVKRGSTVYLLQYNTDMVWCVCYTVKPLYSGHPWNVANWLLYKGGLIIQCTFNREVLFGTLLGLER